MPCYEVRTVSVEFKAENRKLLDAALDKIGSIHCTLADGRLVIDGGVIVLDLANGKAVVQDGQQNQLNELKRAYSREAVKAAAKKCQWSCKLQGNKAHITKMRW